MSHPKYAYPYPQGYPQGPPVMAPPQQYAAARYAPPWPAAPPPQQYAAARYAPPWPAAPPPQQNAAGVGCLGGCLAALTCVSRLLFCFQCCCGDPSTAICC